MDFNVPSICPRYENIISLEEWLISIHSGLLYRISFSLSAWGYDSRLNPIPDINYKQKIVNLSPLEKYSLLN